MERIPSACEEVRRALPWLVDDELEADHVMEVDAHLQQCDGCRERFEHHMRMRGALERATAQILAPSGLRCRVSSAIADARARESGWSRAWPAAAAAAILLALIWRGVAGGGGPLLDAAAASHARDLPMDVIAADIGQVQNYFRTKLPFAVRPPPLAMSPERLGGRVTQLVNRDAAYFRYDTPSGRVSVFVYEGAEAGPNELAPMVQIGSRRARVKRVHGFTTVRWYEDGLGYAVVADMSPHQLARFLPGSATAP